MRASIILGAFMYSVAWLLFASFDFVDSDTIVAYQLMRMDSSKEDVPAMLTLNPTTYRISGQTVVGQTAGSDPRRYTHCAVIDLENWTCTYEDESGRFGFRNGDYYWKDLYGNRPVKIERKSVCRFQYIWTQIKWYLSSDSWLEKSIVLIIPFFV